MTNNNKFELKFDPMTIEHLGVKMYATLPPALAELISNAYDADSSKVTIKLYEKGGAPESIQVIDDGEGMSAIDLQQKFLVIGRNRRNDNQDVPSLKYKRLPTGKKGLGKLSLFGLANNIRITSIKNNLLNAIELDWDQLKLSSGGVYHPKQIELNKPTSRGNGTTIKLSGLKRKSSFDMEGLANSLAKIFIVEDNFEILLEMVGGGEINITNDRRYHNLDKQFEWNISEFISPENPYKGLIEGNFYTSKKPISPASGLRGVTLFSRGKLVNSPEFFSESTSSHFYEYCTGWLTVDFIENLDEDVISTNRQALNWDYSELKSLRIFLASIMNKLNAQWRERRKEVKIETIKTVTGIDTVTWMNSLPQGIRESTQKILDTLSKEDSMDEYSPVISALHDLIPEYPLLHWRHLNSTLKNRVEKYYRNEMYGEAAEQGIKIYVDVIQQKIGQTIDGEPLMGMAFGGDSPRLTVADLTNKSGKNIQEGQRLLSQGSIIGFRHPISHDPIDKTVPHIFTELDCLNVLSLISYLMTRVDGSVFKAG